MKIKLIFHDWQTESGRSIYNAPVGAELTRGDLHHGSVFDAEVAFSPDTERDLREALAAGVVPVFRAVRG